MKTLINLYIIPYKVCLFIFVVFYFCVYKHNLFFNEKTHDETMYEMKKMVYNSCDHALPFSTIVWALFIFI